MLSSFYRKAQYLSLDVVAGAMSLLRFFSLELGVNPEWTCYFLLAAAVWIVYTVDHILDATKASQANRARYQFHLNNRGILLKVVAVVSIVSFIPLFFLSHVILIAGSGLAILVLIYLMVHRSLSKWGMKEFFVALLYTSGVLLTPFAMRNQIDLDFFVPLFLLTLMNLILLSWVEKAEDRKDNFKSIATVLKDHQLDLVVIIVLSLGGALSILYSFSHSTIFFLIGFTVYAYLYARPYYFMKKGMYRGIADGVFILPFVFE